MKIKLMSRHWTLAMCAAYMSQTAEQQRLTLSEVAAD